MIHENVWSAVCRNYEKSDELFSAVVFHNNKDAKVLNVLLASIDVMDSLSNN